MFLACALNRLSREVTLKSKDGPHAAKSRTASVQLSASVQLYLSVMLYNYLIPCCVCSTYRKCHASYIRAVLRIDVDAVSTVLLSQGCVTFVFFEQAFAPLCPIVLVFALEGRPLRGTL